MTRVAAISEAVTLSLSAENLWAYVADYAKDTHWRRGLVEMTPTPTGLPTVGTTVHEAVKKFGSMYVTDSTVTETGPGSSYRFSGVGDSGRVDGGRSVVDNGNQTATFTYDIILHLSGLTSLFAPAVKRLMARGLRSDLQTLRRTLQD